MVFPAQNPRGSRQILSEVTGAKELGAKVPGARPPCKNMCLHDESYIASVDFQILNTFCPAALMRLQETDCVHD